MTFKADLKARAQCHLLEKSYKCKKCCDRCDAIQPFTSQPEHMTYKNTARDAPYAGTCIDHSGYLRTTRKPSPWCKVPGFQFETLSFDTMHLVYLGVAKNHVPSCLKLLQLWGFHYEIGETDEKYLKRVSLEMREDCKKQGCFVEIRQQFNLSNSFGDGFLVSFFQCNLFTHPSAS